MTGSSFKDEISPHSFHRYVIEKPTTLTDDASPSNDLQKDVDRMFHLIKDERHLSALSLYESCQKRLDQMLAEQSNKNNNSNDKTSNVASIKSPSKFSPKYKKFKQEAAQKAQTIQNVQQQFTTHADVLEKLKNRCRLFKKAKQSLNVNADWTLAQTLFGITTYYRREDDGSLSIKLEGKLEGIPLFEQVSVLREVDLHCKWAPFCSNSKTIAHLDKLDTVGWFVVGVPAFGLARDGCFRAIGCDSIVEDGSILLVGQGVADRPEGSPLPEDTFLYCDPVLKELDLPDPPTSVGSGRMTIRNFEAIIKILSPTLAETKLIANIDPNLPYFPQSMLDFLMKKLCGVLLYKLQIAAKKIPKDPIYNPHARKMRQESAFYQDWLMEKFKGACRVRGWKMPPVNAFTLSDEDLEKEKEYNEKKKNKEKSSKKNGKLIDLEHLDEDPEAAISVGHSPRSFTDMESDTISELSLNSASTISSLFRNNPISTFLRDMEEKTQMRKAEEIAKARERAANRLKPKMLQKDRQARLEELRSAKIRRNITEHGMEPITYSQREIATSSSSSSIISDGKSQRRLFVIHFSQHGPKTRMVVTSSLVFILFALLYADFIVSPQKTLFVNQGNDYWFKQRLRDLGTIFYIFLLASVHFTLCYTSCIYSFSALQIGEMAGKKAKRFFRKNMHVILGILSGSIVVLGIGKALFATSLSVFVTIIIRIYDFIGITSSLSLIFDTSATIPTFTQMFFYNNGLALAVPDFMLTTSSKIISVWSKGLSTCFWIMSIVWRIFRSILIDSNPLGRIIARIITGIANSIVGIHNATGRTIVRIVTDHRQDLQIHLWRYDAFRTCRALLSYSAIFLLVVLVIFNVSARQARAKAEKNPLKTSTSNSALSSKLNSPETKQGQKDGNNTTANSSANGHNTGSVDTPLSLTSSKKLENGGGSSASSKSPRSPKFPSPTRKSPSYKSGSPSKSSKTPMIDTINEEESLHPSEPEEIALQTSRSLPTPAVSAAQEANAAVSTSSSPKQRKRKKIFGFKRNKTKSI